MKNILSVCLIILAVLSSCRREDNGQQIDQVINLYIDSAGKDMLNPKIPGGYSTIRLNDVFGLTDTAPVSFTLLKDKDSLYYIEYVAGAKRKGIDSSQANIKIYQSKIALILARKPNDSLADNDTLKLNYIWKPEIFELQQAWYNNVSVFNKVEGQPNLIRISK